ncbi:MAG: type 2 isopentenyl-diphosphate Delta-isomerase [archaeon YNP-LCB-003-016]|jgi:isopentenyl-diphosphate delta-isomerase|uniref:type 2 isopentenyl-diphosphate Delta-isomerase n=1 Tax=Candidatus Culexarchaeum yellowstonense TaxID=2928963 RepID=UPI0026ED1C95|nr:type 2 isopentenyl-diphosphate Delta-isomerase [Candidatus Culexarchaeum yellowstonense]MCC6017565.1 type 2 isopentenyl-diphosphate Delta-isomerase [Candidatus Verstraetearchaeota archaeon]MCR6690944.1 type 2 isopentenyl-diphosphate Delta-isomerase [Candidatus Culexarchaeum yellowstonense]
MIERRKTDHIEICYSYDVEFKNVKTLFEDVTLIHDPSPQINLDDIDLTVNFLGHKLSAPIIISAMTGGSEKSHKINSIIASVVEKLGIGMGVGSQRIAIEKPDLSYTFSVVREVAPSAFIIGNLGSAQLCLGYGLDEARKAVDMINADALAIHFNPLQEAVQHEGEPFYSNVLEKVKSLSLFLGVPLIAKETGSGFSMEAALKICNAGFSAIDVAGAGGTSWAAVEYYRSISMGDEDSAHLAYSFWDWGIPTAASLCEVKSVTDIPIIASGGIRSGIDAAKALALGANCVGLALPIIKLVLERGFDGVYNFIKNFINELKIAMFLVNARHVEDLRKSPIVITGRLYEWLHSRGILSEIYVKRCGNL